MAAARVSWIAGGPAVFIQGPVKETNMLYKYMHSREAWVRLPVGAGQPHRGGGEGGRAGRGEHAQGRWTHIVLIYIIHSFTKGSQSAKQ